MSSERIALFVVTGFLGSGKTSLLRRLLADAACADSLVIINELGAVGLDHEMVRFSRDRTIVLPGGCVCCSIREDIEITLREVFEARSAGRVPAFRRIFIETTGIADPQPLLATLHVNPIAATQLKRPHVITVVDGVLGHATLQSAPEAVRQVAAADTILISKADLATPGALQTTLRHINPEARIEALDLLRSPVVDLFLLLTDHANANMLSPDYDLQEGHAHGVHSFALTFDKQLSWTTFGVWMTMLLHRHGSDVLRVKGILAIEGNAGPVILHAAQHMVHPPEHLSSWEGHPRQSRLVFITRNVRPELIERSFKTFMSVAAETISPAHGSDYLAAGAGGSVAGHPVRRATAPRWLKG